MGNVGLSGSVGPSAGNCDVCRADPQRAEACRQLAFTAQSVRDSQQVGNAPVNTISCSEFLDRATEQGGQLGNLQALVGEVHARPSTSGGYEIEEHEAAQALDLLKTM